LLFREIAAAIPSFEGIDYRSLARTEEQFPLVGGEDLYYGGTSYKNSSGLGQQWPAAAEKSTVEPFDLPDIVEAEPELPAVVGTVALYAHGSLVDKSEIIAPRVAEPTIFINTSDAAELDIADGDHLSLNIGGDVVDARARVDGQAPERLTLLHGAGLKGKPAKLEIIKKRN
jgi:predicted molibdopterin-dependent oxidoreductase YjgC